MPPEETAAAPVAPVTAPVVTEAAPAVVESTGESSGEDALFAKALSTLVADDAPETEAAPEAKPVVEPEKPKAEAEPVPDAKELSNAFAAYKHKMKRLEAERADHAKSLADFDAKTKEREAALAQREQELTTRAERAKKSPAEALKELGWTVEQFLKFVADGGEVPQDKIYEGLREELRAELRQTKEEVAAERAKIEEFQKQQLAAKTTEEARAYEREVGNEIVEVLGAEAEKYKYLGRVTKKKPALVHKGVLDEIAEHWNREKKVLAISDAMLQIEKRLKDQAEALLEEGTSDARQAGAVQPAVQPGNSQQTVEPIPARETARRGVVTEREPHDLTEDERMALALRQARGEA